MNVLREAYDLLKDIPAEDFIVGQYYNPITKKSCALGWYVRKKHPYLKPEFITSFQYFGLSEALRKATVISGLDISEINNEPQKGFLQNGIKERVLACFSHFNIN